MKRERVGRPTKYSDELIDQLCGALADGMTQTGACVVTGIGVSTLAEWKEKFPEIATRMSEAREQAKLAALQSIKAAGDRDWRAHAKWLELTFPSEFRGNRVEVSASASATATHNHISVERQKELQARHAAALSSTGTALGLHSSESEQAGLSGANSQREELRL